MSKTFRRLLLLVLTLISGGLFGFSTFHPEFTQAATELRAAIVETLYSKEIRFKGLLNISRAELQALLPEVRTNFYWHLNRTEVAANLRRHPLVESARVTPCQGRYFRCFEIEIHERQPRYLALVGQNVWLLGSDGGFINPVPAERMKEVLNAGPSSERGFSPVVLKRLMDDGASPDVVKNRFNFMTEAIRIIEERTGMQISEIKLEPWGDLAVSFKELPFPVIFGQPELLGSGEVATDEVFSQQAERLKILTERLQMDGLETGHKIRAVDLAFSKVAVIKTNRSLTNGRSKS